MKYKKAFSSLLETVETLSSVGGVEDPKGELLSALREGAITARGVAAWELPPSPAPFPGDFQKPGLAIGDIPVLWWRSGEVHWTGSYIWARPRKQVKDWRWHGEDVQISVVEHHTGLYADQIEIPQNDIEKLWLCLGVDEDQNLDIELSNTAKKNSFVPGNGRKTNVESSRSNILDKFDNLCHAGDVTFEHGGLQRAAETLAQDFPSYKIGTIRKMIQPQFNELKSRKDLPLN